jgi:hypothetical protein
MAVRLTLAEAIKAASDNALPYGWLYLPSSTVPGPMTECIFLSRQEIPASDDDVPQPAIDAGFPAEGLDTEMLRNVFLCAKQFQAVPSDELLVESFVYYWRFDAFLPAPGAPEPPPPDESRLLQERQYYDSLGPERLGTSCRSPSCERGTVNFSVFCRAHQFEQMWKRACPFNH